MTLLFTPHLHNNYSDISSAGESKKDDKFFKREKTAQCMTPVNFYWPDSTCQQCWKNIFLFQKLWLPQTDANKYERRFGFSSNEMNALNLDTCQGALSPSLRVTVQGQKGAFEFMPTERSCSSRLQQSFVQFIADTLIVLKHFFLQDLNKWMFTFSHIHHL